MLQLQIINNIKDLNYNIIETSKTNADSFRFKKINSDNGFIVSFNALNSTNQVSIIPIVLDTKGNILSMKFKESKQINLDNINEAYLKEVFQWVD